MTADRIQYFEERLKKPIPEPFKSWMEELFAEAKGGKPQPKPAFKASKSLSISPEPEPEE